MENFIVAAKAEYNTQKSSFTTLFETDELSLRIAENLLDVFISFPDTVNRNIIHLNNTTIFSIIQIRIYLSN
ncbi:MAG: hypothetical protein IPJ20_20005 [Flammeovirgaceae bacterium]|nr:hypothetical protein [Flammeovirgaceae bacterium]